MSSRRTKCEELIYQSYIYPGTRVLKNKLDIRDPKLLEQAELVLSTERAKQPLPAAALKLNYEGFLEIHHHLFQDVYDWAGKLRNYTTGRGPIPFSPPENIETWMKNQFRILEKENYLKGLSIEEFANKAAPIVNEINAAHPFIEGNGRTQRLWLRVLAEQAGHTLQFKNEDREKWYEASRIGFERVDHRPMAQLLTECLYRERELPNKRKSISERVQEAKSKSSESIGGNKSIKRSKEGPSR